MGEKEKRKKNASTTTLRVQKKKRKKKVEKVNCTVGSRILPETRYEMMRIGSMRTGPDSTSTDTSDLDKENLFYERNKKSYEKERQKTYKR